MRELGLITLLSFLLIGCGAEKMRVLPFEKVGHIEVSLEKSCLIIRALPAPNSFAVITHYNFQKVKSSDSDKYFLTLYLEVGDKHPVSEIRYVQGGGIEVTIPCDSFNPEKDVIYYKDDKGEYKLNISPYRTWQDYLKSEGIIR
ncbi:MAG: hypothetical protein Q8R31_01900 [Candidatus Omnitrophota bacterium]|nr:hypothetical protein [Candidatus Omnitrophota bacterium]